MVRVVVRMDRTPVRVGTRAARGDSQVCISVVAQETVLAGARGAE